MQSKFLTPALLALSLLAGGCWPTNLTPAPSAVAASAMTLTGTVSFATPRATQATLTEVANAATVSLIDVASGNTVGSSVTDATGAFVLTFKEFTPTPGAAYVLEAIKGLSAGSTPNRVGASAARVRTLLFWNGGWQSFTNSTPGTGITVSVATTALAAIVSHKQQAGTALTLSNLINTVNGNAFTETGTGLSNANDFLPVLSLVSNAITLDQDPVAGLSYNKLNNTYALATGVPKITSYSPAIPVPGGTITLQGSNFDNLNGRNAFWFGNLPAATWSVSVDKTTATVAVPTNAFSAPFVLDQPNGVTQTIAPFLKLKGTVGTLAGNGYASNNDGYFMLAGTRGPVGADMDPAGNFYFTTYNDSLIRKITPFGFVSTVAGSGTGTYAEGTATAASFNAPYSLAMGPDGNLYVADNSNNRIRRVTPSGVTSTFAGNGTAATVDGNGTAASIRSPLATVFDRFGNLYVSEAGSTAIRKITPSGDVTTVVSSGIYTHELVVDSAGNLFACNHFNHQILKITLPGGAVSVVAGSGSPGSSDGTGTAASFNQPVGLAIDGSDNLYVTDYSNHRIRKVTSAGVVTTVAGNGLAAAVDGAAGSASFAYAHDICFDPTLTSLYIAEYGSNRIRVFTP